MIPRKLLILFILPLPYISSFIFNNPTDVQPGYGYVGPACAVFDGTLFLHGVSKRKLNDHEQQIFRSYQHDLSMFKDSSDSFDSFESSLPSIPHFCGGYDDSIEVVLDSCIVRNNHVYVGDNLVRPLTNFETQKIQLIKMKRMYGESRKRRIKKSILPGKKPQRDFTDIFHRLLNINSTVTSRFIPVVSQSPLFAMEGPWQSILAEYGAKDHQFSSSTVAPSFVPVRPLVAPAIDITKIDTPYRASYTTTKPSKPQKPQKSKKPAMATVETTTIAVMTTREPITTSSVIPPTSTTARQISLQSTRASIAPTPTIATPTQTKTKTRTNTENAQNIIQTVSDPTILKLIASALEKNELIDESILNNAMRKKQEFSTPTTTQQPLPSLRFIVPPSSLNLNPYETTSRIAGLSHNYLFIPQQPFTSLASSDSRISAPASLSHRLPNEICRVHLNQNPYRFRLQF